MHEVIFLHLQKHFLAVYYLIKKQIVPPAFYTLLMFLFFSCGDKQTKQAADTTDNSSVYYPVNSYIRQQIKDVDTTPYFLYRLATVDNKKDSAIINRATFDTEMKMFLLPQLEEKALRKDFTEAAFDDESTGSITLTYTPKSKDNPVQNVSVLLDKDNQQVKWIFINTLMSNSDSTVIQRIGWKGGKSCYINTSISYKNKAQTQRQLQFVWNDKEDE